VDGGNTYWLCRCLAALQPADLLTIVLATQVARRLVAMWLARYI